MRSVAMHEKLILRSIADGIIATDLEGRIDYANRVICQLLRMEREALVQMTLRDVLAETELLGMLGLSEAVRPGEATLLQVVFKDGGGDYVPLSVTLSERYGEAGQVQGFVAVCRSQDEVLELLNQSSRLVAEEIERRLEMQRAKDAAERREQLQLEVGHAQKLESIGQLAAGIAHEINTPIQFIGDNVVFLKRAFDMLLPVVESAQSIANDTSIASQVAALKQALRKAKVAYLGAEIPKAIEQTQEGIERVAKIVRAMKEVSHPSSGERQAVDLHRVIDSTVTVARNEWKYVAEVETDFDPNLPPLPCYSDEISQVILNIVVNAAHAIADAQPEDGSGRGTITIATRHDETHAEIQIRDTGTGMPDEVVARIFDPFFTTKEVGKGTGQGLALVYHVVTKRHDGTISVDTAQGQGTTFTIRIPLVPTSPPRSSDPVREQARARPVAAVAVGASGKGHGSP